MILTIILTAISSLMLAMIVSGVAYLDLHRRLLTIIGQVFEAEKVVKGLAFDAELHTRSYREISSKSDELQKAIDHLTEDNLKIKRELENAIEEYDQRYRKVRASLGAKKRYDRDDTAEENQQTEITDLIDQVQNQTVEPAKPSRRFGVLPY